ncbi:annexin A6-like isoform X2 [Styela clava]
MAVSMSVGHFPVGSKLLQKKWNERQLKTHQTKIASMKADIDNKNPLVHSHLRLKLKKIQLEEESNATVQNENKVLVDRISRIMRERGRLDNWNEAYKPRSLNHRYRSTVATKIQGENNLLVKRLNAIKPLYDIRKWENDFNFHEYVLQNMKSTTKDYETVPKNNSRSPQPHHSPTRQEERIKLPSVDFRNGNIKMQSPNRVMKLPKIANPKEENGLTRKSETTAATQEKFDATREAKLLHSCEDYERSTDCSILSRCFAQKRFRERMQIQDEFERLYEEDHLVDFLKERFHPSFNPIITAFLSRREAYDALTLRDALDDAPRAGGRESTLIEIICTRHDLALKAIEKEYANKYGSKLSSDITAMTSGDLKQFLLTLLSQERSSDLDVNQDLASEDAEELLKIDVEDRWRISENSGRFSTMLKTEGYAQMRAAFVEYERMSGLEVSASVTGAMENENEAHEEYWDAVLAFVKCLRNCPSFFADNMHKSLTIIKTQTSDNGKDIISTWVEKTLIRCILTRCEADLSQILRTYKKKFGITLHSDIDESCNLPYKDILLAVIKYQGNGSRKRHPHHQQNGKRVAGMLIRGPPQRQSLSRPTQVWNSSDRLNNSPLNKGQNKPTTTPKKFDENGRINTRRKMSNMATVTQARDFNAERDAEQIGNSLRIWEREGHRTVLSILCGRSNDQRQKLRSIYASKYKRDLVTDLRKTVRDNFYGELLSGWLKTKVEFDATAMHESLTHVGMQEIAMEIFCTRPNKQVKNVADAYRRLYGSTISETIKEKFREGYWKQILYALSRTERDITNAVSTGTATTSATSLYEDEISGLGGSKFIHIFTKCNFSQIKAIINAFKKVSGKDLNEFIKSSPDESNEKKKAMNAIVCCCKDPAGYFCEKLYKLIVEEQELASASRIILSRAEVDLELIKQIYNDTYGKSITEDLNSICFGDYKQFLLQLLNSQQRKSSK